MGRRWLLPALAALLLGGAASSVADPGGGSGPGVYQEPADFLREVFGGEPPPPRRLWLKGELKERVREVLGHDYRRLRVRYWRQGGLTAWILEEIGKEHPITMGVVVEEGHIREIRVLVFRESRGWEIRHPFFTEQFRGAGLEGETRLDRSIDGITGATLSVRAMRKVARLALLLHREVVSQPGSQRER